MPPRPHLVFVILSHLLVVLTPTPAPSATPPARPAVVRRVDHVLVGSAQADELFAWLTGTLRLPVAWPLARYGRFASGGVALGNVNLEILQSAPAPAGEPPNRGVGLALEPVALAASLAELQARGIEHGPPAPFHARRWFRSEHLWTTVALPSVSRATLEVFLCEYTHDSSDRRKQLRDELRSRGGGPLTVDSVREVVVGAAELAHATPGWQALLKPAGLADDASSLGDGPALRLVASQSDTINSLILHVASLQQARQFLQQHGWLGEGEAGAVTISAPLLEGLTLTLVEAAPR